MSSCLRREYELIVSHKDQNLDFNPFKKDNQDCRQRLCTTINVTKEIYRALSGSLLLFFCPHTGVHWLAGRTINCITFVLICIMFFCELLREFTLIEEMDTNLRLPKDADSVQKRMRQMDSDCKNKIYFYQNAYKVLGITAMVFFLGNTILSGVHIFAYGLATVSTAGIFTTNVLFMTLKMVDVFQTIHRPDGIFLSAYLKEKVQYNDIDTTHGSIGNKV